MPIHPSPIAETSGPFCPSWRVCTMGCSTMVAPGGRRGRSPACFTSRACGALLQVKSRPTSLVASEPVSKSHRRFGAMGDAVQTVQRRRVECRRVIDQATIFGAHKDMLAEIEIRAGAVHECGAGLCACSWNVIGIKHQSPDACQCERRPTFQREPQHISGGRFMRKAVDSGQAAGQSVALSIESISVVQLDAVVLVEEEAIAGQYTAAVGGTLFNTVSDGAFYEAAEGLDARLILVDRILLLRKRG